ncbi:Hypothetical predicted protein [Mytilus galloprovincialis]|uniref:Uncharacterized protein n=1 Tax=Mytilus galloprovincialis TaxID=29158 RepID=A0A8B6FNB1_MYTGA|nr:Hypothetical predicted protein [Mytilus galloprovincialis]
MTPPSNGSPVPPGQMTPPSNGSPVPSGQMTPLSNGLKDSQSCRSISLHSVSDRQTSIKDSGEISMYDGIMTPLLLYLTIVDNQTFPKKINKKLTFHDMNNRPVAITMPSKRT